MLYVQMNYKILCCEVFFRETCHLIAETQNKCDVEFLPKGLHDLGSEKMLARLQERVDAVEEGKYDAILLVYGLCNNGVAGLTARHTRLVIPRAHDCITVFLGSREKYIKCFNQHPGTYYRTSGWIERDNPYSAGDETVFQKLGLFMQYEELVAKYGEENAKYVMETIGDGMANYDRIVFIRSGLNCDDHFSGIARSEAKEKGWSFEEIDGSLDILKKLYNGDWDNDFLVVAPGQSIAALHTEDVVMAKKAGQE